MINSTKLGLSGGILWGLSLFVMTLAGIYLDYATDFLNLIATLYPGYDISWGGAFIGLLYGFVDGFLCLFILGWLYNKLNI